MSETDLHTLKAAAVATTALLAAAAVSLMQIASYLRRIADALEGRR